MQKKTRPSLIISNHSNISKELQNIDPSKIPDFDEYEEIIPRTYPTNEMPSKVSIYRKIKEYSEVNINDALGLVNWYEDMGELALCRYVFSSHFVFDYGCSIDNIKRGKVWGRAYCLHTRKYEKFKVTFFNPDTDCFDGEFIQESSKNPRLVEKNIHRAMICFNFENPLAYIEQILQAKKRRKKVIEILKYEFYIDCIDSDYKQNVSKKMMDRIKMLAMAYLRDDSEFHISFDDMQRVGDHYRRVMNEIMFRSIVKSEEMNIYIPHKYIRKTETKQTRKIIVKRDNKVYTIVPRSIAQRLEDLKTKSLFANSNITEILVFLQLKMHLKPHSQFYIQVKQILLEKYIVKQERSLENNFSALNEFVVDPVASEIRRRLIENPDGWFRLHCENKALYLEGKLHKMFIMINNMLREWVVNELEKGLKSYCEFLTNHTPLRISIKSVSEADIEMKNENRRAVLIIQAVLEKGEVKLSHTSEKINKTLTKLVWKSLEKFSRIPSPEPIVLKELLGGYKNQEGIRIELPFLTEEYLDELLLPLSTPISLGSTLKYGEIEATVKKIVEQIDEICLSLSGYEKLFVELNEHLQIDKLINNENKSELSIELVVTFLKEIEKIEQKISFIFNGFGVFIGFFHIDYQIAKKQLSNLLESERQSYQRILIGELRRLRSIIGQEIKILHGQLTTKPINVDELIEKQKIMRNLTNLIESESRRKYGDIRELCDKFGCRIEIHELKQEIDIDKIVFVIYQQFPELQKEFNNMRTHELQVLQNTKKDIEENLRFIVATKEFLKQFKNVDKYHEQAKKSQYVKSTLANYKFEAIEIGKKELFLEIELFENDLVETILEHEKDLEPYDLLWSNLERWKNVQKVWLFEPLGSFELKEPSSLCKALSANFKKASFIYSSRDQPQFKELCEQIKEEIEEFEPKIELLRLLKKKGLSKKHLSEVGIELKQEIEQMTLNEALKMGLLEKMSQIEAVSNDAWNQFSLEQMVDRLLKEIYELKFKISCYKDKKKNDIFIIVNYSELVEQIDSILKNTEAVQFNPMVKMFEGPIKNIYEKIQYISKSVTVCEQFQKIMVELHPIFDSTDIVKQIPSENKKFAKVLRIWLELLGYVKVIISVNDSCIHQNMYEKLKSMLASIEIVRKQLINYLEQKRKGFSRFYLLSNSEMFELFSATSDISSVNRLIPKLFDTVTSLQFKESCIEGISSDKDCYLKFRKEIHYEGVNIESWLGTLEKEIKISIREKIFELFKSQSEEGEYDWLSIVENENTLPQICYLLYELYSSKLLEKDLLNLESFKQQNTKILQLLVERKKRSRKEKLALKSDMMICSLIILVTSKLEIADRMMGNKIISVDDFEWKKLVKSKILFEGDLSEGDVIVESMEHQNVYGGHFLGPYERLVVTDLTEKMQVIYFLAQKYSLGIAAMGPAGTGKSETTKDIAKMIGKTCLIYNCSEDFHESTFIRLLKGLVITGLWMCFDEFNRLDYKLLSVAAEQLGYLFKLRGYNHRMELSFMGESIWINPEFQFCITYNPTYEGRQSLPEKLTQILRTVAVVMPDQFAICQALLYSWGYSQGSILARKIINVFKICREIWANQEIYDFGLRALRSIVNMSSSLFLDGKENEEDSVIKAMKILNTPKMKRDDNEIFIKILSKCFETTLISVENHKGEIEKRLSDFNSTLGIRHGILLCGPALSGKQTIVEEFKKENREWEIVNLYHDALTIEEIFGELDQTTKLWRDGFFTAAVRNNVELGLKRPNLIVLMNGSVYSEWIENLNSFLDATRKISLASGETISIPPSLKVVVTCTDLKKSSPATITRFGLINYEPLRNLQLIENFKDFPEKLITFFENLQLELKNNFLAFFDSRFILNWTLSLMIESPKNYDTFIFYLTQIYFGLLNTSGKIIYERFCKRYLSVNISPFEIMLNTNFEPTSLQESFEKHKNYIQSSDPFLEKEFKSFEEIYVHTLRSYKITQILNEFVLNEKKRNCKLLMIVGDRDIGKTRICKHYLESIAGPNFKTINLFFSRKTTSKMAFKEIRYGLTQKSTSVLGGAPGQRVNIWIENVNMPTSNKFEIFSTGELIRMICSQNSWYNYGGLKKENLEDLSLICDANTSNYNYKNPLNLNPRLYRHIQPIFCEKTTQDELQSIFHSITFESISEDANANFFNHFSIDVIQKIVEMVNQCVVMYWDIKDDDYFEKNIVPFSLNDLYRSLKGLLAWKLPQEMIKINEVLQYEVSRNLLSKLSEKNLKNQMEQVILSRLKYQENESEDKRIPLFHNFENSNISYEKCEKVESLQEFTTRFQCICDEYRAVNKENTTIIVFPEMLEYVIKISRTLSLDNGHCAIVGMSKCGKNTMVKLASYLINSDLYSIKDTNKNKMKDWQEGIKHASKQLYKTRNTSILLVNNKNIAIDDCMEDISKLLLTMNLPHIYSEVDIEELIFMMQADLVKRNLLANKETMWIELIRLLKQKFHIVLLMNSGFSNFKTSIAHYPSLTKACTFVYLNKWPKEALYLIAKLEMPHIHYQLDILPEIYDYTLKVCENSKISLFKSMWEGMYFEFLLYLRKISDKNQSKLELRRDQYLKSEGVIQETQNQLEQTKNKIKKLQPAIIITENETAKTVKNIEIQRKNAEETNNTLIVKNEEAAKIIKESTLIKVSLEEKLRIVDIQLSKAWENVSLIKPAHIAEIKALANPSDFIKTVLAGLVILTFDGQLVKEVKEVNGTISIEDSHFETAKKFVLNKDSKAICKMLMDFKRENVSEEMFEKLEKKCLSNKRWSEKEAKNANKAIYYFFLWVEAVSNQYRIYEETRPLREDLEKTTSLLNSKEIEISTIKRELSLYQSKINEYESLHKVKKEALEDYRLQIRHYESLLNKGNELIKEISGEKEKWNNYIKEIDQKLTENFGDSIIMAATIAFLSPHVYEIRKKVKQHIFKLCKDKNIFCSVSGNRSCEIPWYLSQEEKQIYQSLQIHQNELMIDNIKVSEFCNKVSLLVDPEDQGLKLMKQLNWQQNQTPIDKISELSPNMLKYIESGVLYGRIVFVEIDPRKYNESLNFIIHPTIIRNTKGGRELKSGEKTIPIHESYRVFLYTTSYSEGNKSKLYSMELLTNIQVINFKMTLEQLEERILEAMINQEMPLLKARIEELLRVNIKDTIVLNSIEEKLLVLFGEQLTPEELLENDEIINTVVQSNRLYRQISHRIEESKAQGDQIENEKRPYRKKSSEICHLYRSVQRLQLISLLYSYSYHWFLDIFEANIQNFNITLYQEIAKALQPEERIIVSILIAEVVYPNLPWKCLFNVDEISNNKTIYTANEEEESNADRQSIANTDIESNINFSANSNGNFNKVMFRIRQVAKFIPTLESTFTENYAIFGPILFAKEEDIFEAIPDEYSHLDFFYRILLISCFRPELVMNLLKEWIQINMGPQFVETEVNLEHFLKNTKPSRPIITIMHEPPLESNDRIREIYKNCFKKDKSSPLIVNYYFTPNSIITEEFDTMIKTCIAQNQWLLVELATSTSATTFIQEYLESITIQADKNFRMWIMLPFEQSDSHDLNGRFIKFSDKMRLNHLKSLHKEIGQSFFKYCESAKRESDFFERGKKKMMISQLCILHHLLVDFSEKEGKQRNNSTNQILSLTQWDLKLTIEEMNEYKVEEVSKRILDRQLICQLTYGSKINSYFLEQLLSVNSRQIVMDIMIERSSFFETLWGDGKFPKDSDEYEHEVRSRISRNGYNEIFGLDYKLHLKIKEHEYNSICKFYEKTMFHEAKNRANLLMDKLDAIVEELEPMKSNNLQMEVKNKLENLYTFSALSESLREVYHFCRIEFEENLKEVDKIFEGINDCVLTIKHEKEVEKNSQIELFMLNIYRGTAYWSLSHRPIRISQYCYNLIDRFKKLSNFLTDFDKIGNVVDCAMINNFHFYLQVLLNQWQIKKQEQEFKLVFIPFLKGTNLIDELEKYGFVILEDSTPNQKIYDEYGQEIELKTDYKVSLSHSKLSCLDTNKAKERGILGYTFIENFILSNTNTQVKNNQVLIKTDSTKKGEDFNNLVTKNLLNFALNMQNKSIKEEEKSIEKISDSSLSGILFIASKKNPEEIVNTTVSTKNSSKIKSNSIFEDENRILIPLPCYNYSFVNMGEECSPVALIEMLFIGKLREEIEKEVIRKNIHLSLRP